MSSLVFVGLMEATGDYGSLTLAPLEGLTDELKARGEELARERGLVSRT